MRISAQTLFAVFLLLVMSILFKGTADAQTPISPTPTPLVATTDQSSNGNNFIQMNTDSNVPQNRDSYTQVLLINTTAAFMCQLAGVDPINPQQPCLGVDPTTGKIGMIPSQSASGASQSQIGGAVGLMSGYISALYILQLLLANILIIYLVILVLLSMLMRQMEQVIYVLQYHLAMDFVDWLLYLIYGQA